MHSEAGWIGRLRLLTRGDPRELSLWLREPVGREGAGPGGAGRGTLPALMVAIVGGAALYGFSLGFWRAPLQGLYVAIKLPCLVFLTLLVNGGINGMLGQLLGSGMTFRQTLVCCLMSFATFALLVGSLSPIVCLWVLDAPDPLAAEGRAWYRYFLLVNTGIIAVAGIIANVRLLRLIQEFTGERTIAARTLFAWLSGNLFVGAQLSFIFRPFFGNPRLPVQFLRPDPLDGNFYQTVWYMLKESIDPQLSDATGFLVAAVVLAGLFALGHALSAAQDPASGPPKSPSPSRIP